MRNVIGVALAGALATATVVTTSETASANSAGAFIVGALVGGAVVAYAHGWRPFANTRTYSYYVAPASNHVAWCRAHYRSYRSDTDTFTGYNGVTYACVSPH